MQTMPDYRYVRIPLYEQSQPVSLLIFRTSLEITPKKVFCSSGGEQMSVFKGNFIFICGGSRSQ